MKSLIAKASIALFGLSTAALPIAASAAPWSVGVSVGGPGYSVRAGYVNPPRRYWRPYAYRPYAYRVYARPYAWYPPYAYYDGYYGLAPAGFYGYYWRGGWYPHRRWAHGVWIYF